MVSSKETLQVRIEKAKPRRNLSAEEANRLAKLEGIAEKLKRGENVQNRQLQTWSADRSVFLFFVPRLRPPIFL